MINNSVIGIIPVRLQSTRLKNKVLMEIDHIPIIQRVIFNVLKSNIVDNLIVVTDSMLIVDLCYKLNIQALYMKEDVSCGSERAWYIWEKYKDYTWYITFPSDEPMLDPLEIRKMWNNFLQLDKNNNEIYTCYSKFYDIERVKLNRTCKIVKDKNNNALYFSRAIIPSSKDKMHDLNVYNKHVGIFIFNNNLFMDNELKNIWESDLSRLEGLEQNAFLENGFRVKLLEIDHKYHGVDVKDDIDNIEKLLKRGKK